jgi:hypothetical protein
VNVDRTPAWLTDPTLVEGRLGARLAGALTERADALPPDVQERLRFAREQALLRARAARGTPVRGLARFGPWWPRLGALLPIMVLAVGSFLVLDLKQREDIAVAAEIDAALLADDLPPEAFADPGFAAFLKLQQP